MKRRIASLLVVALTVAVSGQALPKPVAAQTAHERFIYRIYQDFVLRDPTEAEVAWITASMNGGQTRSARVNELLTSAEFGELAAYGVYSLYLGRPPTDPELASGAALVTSKDYFSLETSLLASSEYLANAGGTNQGFVTNLYNSVYDRAPDSAGLTYWTGQLDTAARTRLQVASSFIRNTEGAGLRVGGKPSNSACPTVVVDDELSLYAGAYCIVLDRMASSADRTYWTGQLQSNGNNLPTLLTQLAASSEYFANA